MHVMVAEQPAMSVVMPAVMARVAVMCVTCGAMAIMVMSGMVMGRAAIMHMVMRDRMGMAIMAMIVLAFAHGAVSICRKARVTRPS